MTPIPELSLEALTEPMKKTMARYGFFLWLATVVAIMLGFRTFTPSERLTRIEAVQDTARIERQTLHEQNAAILRKEAAEARWMCLHSTRQEKALLPELECR